jgi:hypothetical protein
VRALGEGVASPPLLRYDQVSMSTAGVYALANRGDTEAWPDSVTHAATGGCSVRSIDSYEQDGTDVAYWCEPASFPPGVMDAVHAEG